MVAQVMALPEGTRLQLLSPVVRDRKGEYRKELAEFARQGFVRARIDGRVHELGSEIKLAKSKKHDIELVVDRIAVRESVRARVTESLETALRLAGGLALVEGDGGRELFSQTNACVDCGVSFPELAPRLFSFNSPAGACPRCDGLGSSAELDPAKLVPDADRPLREAIAPWGGKGMARYYRQVLAGVAAALGVSLDTPWRELPARVRAQVLSGTGAREIDFSFGKRGLQKVARRFDGVLGELERRRADGDVLPEELLRYARPGTCPECGGARIGREARHVKLGGLAIHELAALPIADARSFLDRLELGPRERAVADRVLAEIRERLRFLSDVGVDYLTLDRAANTLSGGESQRIRLATQVGSQLMGVLYILDEPSIGLHPRDHQRLLASLLRLRDAQNTVVVVEHDEATIRRADWVIDMGPGAGVHGGEVVAAGTPDEIAAHPRSETGAWLSGRKRMATPARRPVDVGVPRLVVSGCRARNLQHVTASIPLGRFTVVTGVSGSGKSTLVSDTIHPILAGRLHGALAVPGAHERVTVVTGVSGSGKSTLVSDTLHPILAGRLHGALAVPGAHERVTGAEHVDKVIEIDQSPIGRTPRSNPATYTGVFDGIRRLFAQVPEARVRGYGPGRFSFNVKGGRCESCEGDGELRVEMHFLPDLHVTCEVCGGRRYNRETLEVRYKGKSIAEVLATSVEESLTLFENVPPLRRPLETLAAVGLGYLQLGQPATTLSGGEAQRIKLARELARRATGRTLYLLDEPTTGLHFADVANLLGVLHRLVGLGNTVVVVEHNLDVIRSADWVIDLGPEGGASGGEIVAAGRPEDVAREPRSHTGRALAGALA
jgi:excinuclease ABC subunit A